MKENYATTKSHSTKFLFDYRQPVNDVHVSSTLNGCIKQSYLICVVDIHPEWRSYLETQLVNRCFRFRFSYWLLEMWKLIIKGHCHIRLCDHCSVTFQSLSEVHSEWKRTIKVKVTSSQNTVHNLEPEIRWSIRILPQVIYLVQLEAVFAWLSTLGGAHSALGDYFSRHAEIAWELSIKQMQVALKIGDPVLAAHCKIFMAISLMQRSHLSTSSKLLRCVHQAIKNDKRLQEKRLINCCKAARIRLKYVRRGLKA